MDRLSAIIAGVTLITVVGVEYGGIFMLSLLRKRGDTTPTQLALFRAGHAHAGVLIILGLVTLLLLAGAGIGWPGKAAAIGVLVGGPILVPVGFFLSPLGPHRDAPGPLIKVAYVGAAVMAISLLAAGVLLITAGVSHFGSA